MKVRNRLEPEADEGPLARRLQLAVHAAEIGFWEWDLRTDEFRYSDRAKQIFGFAESEDVTRDKIVATLHPADHQIAKEQAERGLDPSLKKRDPYRYRIYRSNDGELRWIHAFGEPEFEESNGALLPIRYVGILQDVTDEVLARERLVQQEARLRLAIEASGIAVWELNQVDQTITHSPELNRLCGFPDDARPTLDDFRSRYAPGERERIEREGARLRELGETKYETEIHHIWPDGTEKWLSLRAQLAPGETSYDGRVIGVLVDITAQKQREEQQALLVAEFKHRIQNSFAITQSIINQTLRGEEISESVRSKLFARLRAMSDAHDLIADGAWEGASLSSITRRIVDAFDESGNNRVAVNVDNVRLSPRAAISFALVLHELCTNAIKYGALSNAEGRVEIDITRNDRRKTPWLRFSWVEVDGPPVAEFSRTGFGTRLIDHVFKAEFGSRIKRTFKTGKFIFTLEAPMAQVTDT